MKLFKKNVVVLLLLMEGISLNTYTLPVRPPCMYRCCEGHDRDGNPDYTWSPDACPGTEVANPKCIGSRMYLKDGLHLYNFSDSDWDSSTNCPKNCCSW